MNLSQIKNRIEKIVHPSEEEWLSLFDGATQRFVKKGECIWEPQNLCKHLIFINEGLFRYYHIHNGKDISLQFMFSNNFIVDYASFVNNEPVEFFYEALEDSTIILLPKKSVYNAIEKHRVWERFARLISEQNAILIGKRKNSLIFDSPEEQYLKLIIERPKVIATIPQHMIATYLGVTREHLSRIRRKIANK